MHAKVVPFALSSLFIALLSGPASAVEDQRVIRFSSTVTEPDIQNMITVIRSITSIQQVTAVAGQPAIALSGESAQIAAAGWIAGELDTPNQGIREYRIPDSSELVRVFYLKHRETAQSLNEAATLIRSIGEMRRMFTYNSRGAILVRGTPDQIALAEWLIGKLDQPVDRPPDGQVAEGTSKYEYKLSAAVDDVVRVFYIQHCENLRDLNELATVIRSTGDIRRLFVDPAQKAIAVRGTAGQIALAGWMIHELDGSSAKRSSAQGNDSDKREYHLTGSVDDHVRVFCLVRAETPQRFQEITAQIRATGQLPRVFSYSPQRAVAVRGTASQIAVVEGLIMQFDR